MARRHRRHGRSPGEVLTEDVEGRSRPQIQAFSFNEQELEERSDVPVDEALAMARDDRVLWLNVDGQGDLSVLQKVWDRFDVHPLVREDVVNLQQRPKFEEYPDQGFLVMQMTSLQEGRVATEQVAIVFGPGWLLSFQQQPGDLFEPVRERLRLGRKRMRRSGSDYLAYALMDAVVDGFFPVLEAYGERLEALEREALQEPEESTIERIYLVKRELLQMRRALWPLREAVSHLQRVEPGALVDAETQTYVRDAYDHCVRIMDMLEVYRELATSLTDVYYSTMSHRMNEVMKVLTIAATIFIPLTFIAGIYGMNFQHMPELGYEYGYAAVWAVMLAVGLGMVVFFRRRGWL